MFQAKKSTPMAFANRYKLAQGHYTMVPSEDSNPQPVNHKSAVLPIALPRHLRSMGGIIDLQLFHFM